MMRKNTVQLSITVIFTALVCVATMSFTIYVPSTKGFFNIGETMVYTAALLFGTFVGAFAGGVGSMFADIFLGYYYYAPATLVIKALEGGLVGFLSRKKPIISKSYSRREWRIFTLEIAVLVGALVSLIGFLYYSGIVEFYSGVPPPENPTSTIFGGLIMVSGYFLYQQFILGVLAIAEVPVNIGQMTIGLIVAAPIVKIIQRTLPQLKG